MSGGCRGFRFGAVSAGIKSSGALDLGVILCDQPASAAAVFTRNRVQAAPVRLSRAMLERSRGRARAIVVNSGNANACTGKRGQDDARRMGRRTAEALGADPTQVLVASTGVIGVPLPIERIEAGIERAVAEAGAKRFDDFSRAILTTDRGPKTAVRTVTLAGQRITLLGCTKGAGMIAPNMATTLSFVVTDARLPPAALRAALGPAADATFNAMSVDGDTSTNDMIALLAGGAADVALGRKDQQAFAGALRDLLSELAHALMGDGEGVHHVVTVRVRGARSVAAARKVARRIAESPLVKTAIAGRDPNWGRILCAAGNGGVALRPERLDLWFEDVPIVRGGVAVGEADVDRRAEEVMSRGRYQIVLDLNLGSAEAAHLACDLSHEYVSINADYRT